MKFVQHRLVRGMAITAIATVAVLSAGRSTAMRDLERWTYDFTVNTGGLTPPSKDIVFVDFDEETFRHIPQYPIPRTVIADSLTRIAEGKPKVIGVDLFLSEARKTDEDEALADAITEAKVVILASQAATGTLPPNKPLAQFCQPEDASADSGFCIEGTSGAQGYAFVNMPVDADGFVRQANLFSAGLTPAVSFPLTLAQQFAGESIKPGNGSEAKFLGHSIPYADTELKTILIGTWGKEPVTHVSAWRLLAGEIGPSMFTDKVVLIGQSSDAARDTHLTPLFRTEDAQGIRLRMGGTAIQGAAVRTLLEGRAVKPAPGVVRVISIVAASLMAALFLLAADLGPALARILGLMGLWLGASLLLYAKARFWLPFFPAELGMALTVPFSLGLQFAEQRLISREAHAQREQLMQLFSSYVDPAVAETIWKRRNELCLGGEEHVATVMFTDIRGFTSLSANQKPADVLCWLNRYLTAMDEVIREHGGFLNKFIGDGLMIIFGLPLSHGAKQDAVRAVQAAEAMLRRVTELNEEKNVNPPSPQLRIGVGIHTGTLMAGSIGSASRQEYSVIGETVNLASRLETLNKQYGTEILLSMATWEIAGDAIPGMMPLGKANVPGLDEPVSIFTLRSVATSAQP